ncbi:RNA-directed DNA polymerase from mobile element jockey [Eumeta japonica]|uniref:RNA-directed DNA polymerase from mobile element jockey n=1 Tax=Eumeta variegata TaxID=151549 RepID=A0A4C1ZHH9_EUMVA|nr:RNA-directed DNA polymerase from mobile element jockey [Eumeta japonica]
MAGSISRSYKKLLEIGLVRAIAGYVQLRTDRTYDRKVIDHAIGALTSHVRTVVKRCEREVPASSDRRKFPPDILELIRAKTKLLAARAHIPLPNIDPASSPTRSESSRSGIPNESWSDHGGNHTVTQSVWRICAQNGGLISRIEEEVLQNLLEPKDDLTPVSLSEVQLLVRSLKTRAPGLDGVSNKAIKCFPQQLLSLLVAILMRLQNCYFPPAWKEAEVIGIHKPGKPRDLSCQL